MNQNLQILLAILAISAATVAVSEQKGRNTWVWLAVSLVSTVGVGVAGGAPLLAAVFTALIFVVLLASG